MHCSDAVKELVQTQILPSSLVLIFLPTITLINTCKQASQQKREQTSKTSSPESIPCKLTTYTTNQPEPANRKRSKNRKMKREGFQHGTVRNAKAAAAASDYRMKAPSKPTGHSRYTGKCKKARCVHCHSHPVSKSRDKAKGTYKLKSGDVVLNHRLVSWRVAAGNKDVHLSKYSGVSASGILDALLSESCMSQEADYDREMQNYGCEDNFDESIDGLPTGNQNEEVVEEEEEHAEEIEEVEEEKEEDMGFYEVGFVWEYLDEDGWCVVDEM